MNHTVAEEDLKVISGLLEEWRKTGRLGGLEYDLLLDKIKSLYETVRFGGGQHDESTPCREAASVVHVNRNRLFLPGCFRWNRPRRIRLHTSVPAAQPSAPV